MILINNIVLIKNKKELNSFIDNLQEEVYDKVSKDVSNCIKEFLIEVHKRDEKLTNMVHKRISYALDPLIVIDLSESGNWSDLQIKAVPKNKAYKNKTVDAKNFNGLCDIYFKGLKSLYDRFSEIEVDEK